MEENIIVTRENPHMYGEDIKNQPRTAPGWEVILGGIQNNLNPITLSKTAMDKNVSGLKSGAETMKHRGSPIFNTLAPRLLAQ